MISSVLLGYTILREPLPRDYDVTAAEGLIVLELFTSQGCSSCPPAESVLSKIAHDKAYSGSVIPLAYHVDYWDYLGWKDPFSSQEWTNWQADYRLAFGGATLYTPQIVIQGQFEMVGSNEAKIKKRIQDLLRDHVSDYELDVQDAVLLPQEITLDVVTTQHEVIETPVELVTVVYENIASTQVESGENAGRTLRNNYVVRKMERIPLSYDAGEEEMQIKVSLLLEDDWSREDLGVVSWIQDAKSMQIYTARKALLKGSIGGG